MSAVKIEAFTFEYCELQDRVRLSGNVYNTGIEIHLWLTRRLALRLLESAVDLIEKTSSVIAKTPVDHRAAMALFEHESARLLTENVIETSSKMAGITSDSSLKVNLIEVINRLDISFKDKKYQLSFFVPSQDQVIASAIVDYNQLHQILSLIHKGTKALDWGAPEQLFAVPQQLAETLQ